MEPPSTHEQGAGRPPTYCGTACRRFAEHSVRRIDRRLQKIEDILSDARTDLDWKPEDERATKMLRVYTTEKQRLDERMRELLCD